MTAPTTSLELIEQLDFAHEQPCETRLVRLWREFPCPNPAAYQIARLCCKGPDGFQCFDCAASDLANECCFCGAMGVHSQLFRIVRTIGGAP